VSHKTEYGHYDPEKISLRQEALKWMTAKRFFEPEYFGINKEDVFFVDTREKKVQKIGLLKCEWFIDDLPEVFKETHFPSYTKKILFGRPNGKKPSYDIIVMDSWNKISNTVLGQIKDDDIISWLKQLIDKPTEKIEKIPGRGNSNVYKITLTNGYSYVLKRYPDQTSDTRPRLETELNTLRLLHQHNIKNVPKAVEGDDDLNLGLYEWINGEKVITPANNDLDQAIDFVKKLYSLSQKIDGNDIDLASEACLSARDLISQIEKRLSRLKLVSKSFPELSTFLERTFESLWAKVKDKSISLWPFESRDNILPKKKQTLSPSDFGFHNSIKLNDGALKFIDFDYFGWDDPVKLTADFIWHPAMNMDSELKQKWQKAMLNLFSNDREFESRLNAAMPLYGLRWAMIVLNEFLPELAQRRKEAGGSKYYNLEKSQKIQLIKAEQYCKSVKKMVS
jgi:thiamine kinase-like enzyme